MPFTTLVCSPNAPALRLAVVSHHLFRGGLQTSGGLFRALFVGLEGLPDAEALARELKEAGRNFAITCAAGDLDMGTHTGALTDVQLSGLEVLVDPAQWGAYDYVAVR